jgi:diacylglycerol kinase family enzyme
VDLDVEGAAFRRTTPFVFVGNNIYETEGRRLGARNRLDAGVLCIWVARAGGRMAIFRTALAGLLGRLKNSRELDMLSARDAWINAGERAVSVSVDGEVIRLKSPLHYRIRHGALRVFAPAGEKQG